MAALFVLLPATAAAQTVSRRSPVTDAVAKVGPAVVNISTEQRVRNPFADSPFGRSFPEVFGGPSEGFVENSLGSGVLIDADGYVLTNEHVLLGASRITVSLADGRKFEADVVGTDPGSDLAVVRIQSDKPLPAVALGTSSDLLIGETVIAIGNPLGLSNTVTVGVVSALKREVRGGDRVYADFVQTDAPINPGNSGGPLLNVLGQLIGINTSIVAEAEGIGFAIPIDRARLVIDEILRFGKVREAWVGVDVRASGGGRAFDATEPKVMVMRSYVGGPGDRAGVKPGDLVVAVDGKPIRSLADWDTSLGTAHVGGKLALKLDRGGRPAEASVAVETFPYDLAPNIVADLVGVEIANITDEMRRRATLPRHGVVITGVRPGSPASRVGIKPGDVIQQVNDSRIDQVEEFSRAVPRMLERESVLFVVMRRGVSYYVTLELS